MDIIYIVDYKNNVGVGTVHREIVIDNEVWNMKIRNYLQLVNSSQCVVRIESILYQYYKAKQNEVKSIKT